MTILEAQEVVRRSPEYWRQALVEGSQFPLIDPGNETTEVQLFELKKDAYDAFRARKKELEADGFKKNFGTLTGGFLRFVRGDEVVGIGLDHQGRLS